MSKIITIGREFGSGGREIGKRLSDELGIAYYDNEIITQIAERTKLAEGYVQHVMESSPSTFMPITIGRSFYMGVDPIVEQCDLSGAESFNSGICREIRLRDCRKKCGLYSSGQASVPPVYLCRDGTQDGALQKTCTGE